MKMLLVNPVTVDMEITSVLPNLGLAYLATALRKNNFEVEILDGLKNGVNKNIIKARLKKNDYNIVGFQTFTFTLNKTKEYLRYVKLLNPQCTTVVGGPHPSGDRENILSYLRDADFAIIGEGEEGLPELVKLLSQNKNEFYNIPNLIWRKNGEMISNPIKYIQDLDALDFPAWDLINPLEYPQAPIGTFIKEFPVAPISTIRGCPFSCNFCAAYLIMGKKLRVRNIDIIIEEIKMLVNKYNIKEIQIIDDSFTHNKNFVIDFCEKIIKEKLKLYIALSNGVRIETLDKVVLDLLQKAGCYSITVGIESGSERIIQYMKRNQSIQEIKERISYIAKNTNIRITGNFIIGYPQETKEDILKTIHLAKQLYLSRAQFAFYLPLPGSEMYKELQKNGKISNINYDKLSFQNVCFSHTTISKFNLKLLKLRAYLEFYLRVKILLGVLREIKSFQHLRFIFRRIKMLFK